MTIRDLYNRIDWSLVDGAMAHVNEGKETVPAIDSTITNRCIMLEQALYGDDEKRKEGCIANLTHFGVWGQVLDTLKSEGLLDEERANSSRDGCAREDRPGGDTGIA